MNIVYAHRCGSSSRLRVLLVIQAALCMWAILLPFASMANSCGTVATPACRTIGFAGNGRRYVMMMNTTDESAGSGVIPDNLISRLDNITSACDCYQACKAAAFEASLASSSMPITSTNVNCKYWGYLSDSIPYGMSTEGNNAWTTSISDSFNCFLLSSSLVNLTVLQWNSTAPNTTIDVSPNDVSGNLLEGHPMAFAIVTDVFGDEFPIYLLSGSDDCKAHMVLPAVLCSIVIALTLVFVVYKFTHGWRPPFAAHLDRMGTCFTTCFLMFVYGHMRKASWNIHRKRRWAAMAHLSAILIVFYIPVVLSATFTISTLAGNVYHELLSPNGPSSILYGAFTARYESSSVIAGPTFASAFGYACDSAFPSSSSSGEAQTSNRGQCYLVQVTSAISFFTRLTALIVYLVAVRNIQRHRWMWTQLIDDFRLVGPPTPPFMWAEKYEAVWKAMRLLEVAVALYICTILLQALGTYLILTYVSQCMNNLLLQQEVFIFGDAPYQVEFSSWELQIIVIALTYAARLLSHQLFLIIPMDGESSPVLINEVELGNIQAELL